MDTAACASFASETGAGRQVTGRGVLIECQTDMACAIDPDGAIGQADMRRPERRLMAGADLGKMDGGEIMQTKLLRLGSAVDETSLDQATAKVGRVGDIDVE